MAEPKMCAMPGCGNPAAYRTRSKPAYCAECIERIASDAGLALEEPVVKPNDFIMTTCKRCGGRAHYRFNYILDKRGIGEPVCRRCYWESWYRGSWEQFGVGQGHKGAMSEAGARWLAQRIRSRRPRPRRRPGRGALPRQVPVVRQGDLRAFWRHGLALHLLQDAEGNAPGH